MYHHYIQKGKFPREIDVLPYEEKELIMASMIVQKEYEKRIRESGVM